MNTKTYIIAAGIGIAVIIGIVIAASIAMSTPSSTTTGNSDNTAQLNVFSTDSSPYGLPYAEWTAKWWQWVLETPEDTNPLLDNTGEYCNVNQNEASPVFFLAGTTGGAVERTCSVPAGKAILFPAWNSECNPIEYPALKTKEEFIACTKEGQDQITDLQADIDGVGIPNLKNYNIQSPFFKVKLPEKNLLGVPAGTETEAVSDGYWVFIGPLDDGEHTIHFKGVQVDYTTAAQNSFSTETTYHLTVK
jgi:hypothetical protein